MYPLLVFMEFVSHWIAELIVFIGNQARVFWENVTLLNFSTSQILLDIIIVAVIFYFLFSILKGSRALHVLIGLGFIGGLFIVSRVFQLVALSWLLERFFTIILVAIPVLFQQEFRMALERLGHTKLFLQHKEQEIERMTQEIVNACTHLAGKKIGALIVLQQNITLKEYEDTGISLQAKVSAELIEAIFHTTSPMHDGAIIIGNQRIRSASSILPHSYKNTPGLGTRHKAALGLSETTDAAVIVVSEEKGTISFAKGGSLEKNIQADMLYKLIIQTLQPPRPKKNHRKKS